MKKSVGTAGAIIGSLLATNVAAQDMNEVKKVDTSHLDQEKLSLAIEDTKSSVHDIRVYGVWTRYSDNSSDGGGVEIEWPNYKIGLEGTEDYSRAFGVGKVNFTDNAYSKIGAWFLQKEISVDGVETDVDQTTLGWAVGYGDNTHYNIEAWYIRNDLDNANDRTDTTTYATYVEGLIKYDTRFGWVEAILSYEDVKAYDERFRETSASLGYYPMEDIRLWVNYDSLEHDSNDYKIMAGLNYRWWEDIFGWDFSPFVRASANTWENVSITAEYSNNIQNKPLQMRDHFENSIGTNTLVAQDYNPNEFSNRTQIQIDDTPDDTPEVVPVPNSSISFTIVEDCDWVVIDEWAGTITVDTQTPNSMTWWDWIATLTINTTNGGYVIYNWVTYQNWENVDVSDWTNFQLKLYKSDDTLQKTYIVNWIG